MRYAPGTILVLTVLAFSAASVAEAQTNDMFTVVLHARTPSGTGACTAADLPTCAPGSRPVRQVTAATEFRLFIFVNNHSDIQGFITAFAWPADWSVDPDGEPPVVFGCRGNQLNASEPSNPGGPTSGTIATAFDVVCNPGLLNIGRIDFLAGASGCLTQVNPTQGSGLIEIASCANVATSIDANDPGNLARLGSICIGSDGVDSCDAAPVEPATWGQIKNSYR